ncbi:hypothetical protein GCM10007415_10280 [Parapedobacter pyrenivorans]|uniref:Uncharacterized protein n=1 Tax=Parapedobacter pyrenivorans TaxID=1305674 RepID=A0A917HIP1_9SPHI|nr:hypothetical protein [Parapedobacter pyrenivorans]GGG79906.1 hypothetical protein GCM10007415_10280 [Parapedobacter pyrenivorans]
MISFPKTCKHKFSIPAEGIEKQRPQDIYFNTGAPEPYEFLLIEKAVGKLPGEMMKDYVEKYPVKKGKE